VASSACLTTVLALCSKKGLDRKSIVRYLILVLKKNSTFSQEAIVG